MKAMSNRRPRLCRQLHETGRGFRRVAVNARLFSLSDFIASNKKYFYFDAIFDEIPGSLSGISEQ